MNHISNHKQFFSVNHNVRILLFVSVKRTMNVTLFIFNTKNSIVNINNTLKNMQTDQIHKHFSTMLEKFKNYNLHYNLFCNYIKKEFIDKSFKHYIGIDLKLFHWIISGQVYKDKIYKGIQIYKNWMMKFLFKVEF